MEVVGLKEVMKAEEVLEVEHLTREVEVASTSPEGRQEVLAEVEVHRNQVEEVEMPRNQMEEVGGVETSIGHPIHLEDEVFVADMVYEVNQNRTKVEIDSTIVSVDSEDVEDGQADTTVGTKSSETKDDEGKEQSYMIVILPEERQESSNTTMTSEYQDTEEDLLEEQHHDGQEIEEDAISADLGYPVTESPSASVEKSESAEDISSNATNQEDKFLGANNNDSAEDVADISKDIDDQDEGISMVREEDAPPLASIKVEGFLTSTPAKVEEAQEQKEHPDLGSSLKKPTDLINGLQELSDISSTLTKPPFLSGMQQDPPEPPSPPQMPPPSSSHTKVAAYLQSLPDSLLREHEGDMCPEKEENRSQEKEEVRSQDKEVVDQTQEQEVVDKSRELEVVDKSQELEVVDKSQDEKEVVRSQVEAAVARSQEKEVLDKNHLKEVVVRSQEKEVPRSLEKEVLSKSLDDTASSRSRGSRASRQSDLGSLGGRLVFICSPTLAPTSSVFSSDCSVLSPECSVLSPVSFATSDLFPAPSDLSPASSDLSFTLPLIRFIFLMFVYHCKIHPISFPVNIVKG